MMMTTTAKYIKDRGQLYVSSRDSSILYERNDVQIWCICDAIALTVPLANLTQCYSHIHYPQQYHLGESLCRAMDRQGALWLYFDPQGAR
jgi:hypothetical protein